MRKTKIIATIGPASRNADTLEQLFSAGMDCARLNFSHGSLDEHGEVIRTVRRLSQAQGRPVAILQDLGGVKMRLGELPVASGRTAKSPDLRGSGAPKVGSEADRLPSEALDLFIKSLRLSSG